MAKKKNNVVSSNFNPARFRMGEEASMAAYERQAQIDATTKAAEEELRKAEEFAKAAREGEERARVEAALAQSEKEKADAEAALKAAKEAADKAAAEAAAKAAQEKADLEAKLKAAQQAAADAKSAAEKAAADAAAAAAQAAIDAANRAAAAGANVNTAGNVFLGTTPLAGGKSQADLAAENYAKLQAEKEKTMQRQSIMDVLTDRFTKYNLTGLIPTIKRLAQEGATESTITFALQETEDYRRRFAANEQRLKKGLQALDPASYLNAEDRYRQYLRDYGLKQFDTDDYVRKFIENDTSVNELSNRINIAASRIQNADPAVKAMLREYYKLDDTQLLAYVLDPESQIGEVERRAAAGEIGAAAARQGIRAGVDVAEQLATQGITQAAAQRGYANIANVLPTSEKLSQIYGTGVESYGLAEAEQEFFNTLASAQRKRERLKEREIAEFSGSSGIGKTSLDTGTRGGF